MKQVWPIIAVEDVVKSSRWYSKLLDAEETHPGAPVFNQITDSDGTTLVCLHHWGPSGARGDKHWPSLTERSHGNPANGLMLWFVVDDFDMAWKRGQEMVVQIVEEPNIDNGTGMRAFMIRDLDGYYVVVNEARPQ